MVFTVWLSPLFLAKPSAFVMALFLAGLRVWMATYKQPHILWQRHIYKRTVVSLCRPLKPFPLAPGYLTQHCRIKVSDLSAANQMVARVTLLICRETSCTAHHLLPDAQVGQVGFLP